MLHFSLEKVKSEGEYYDVTYRVPKTLWRYYQELFRGFECASKEMFSRARVADALDEKKHEERQKDLRKGWDAVKARMRWRYDEELERTGSAKEAMKVITEEFHHYWWLKKEFRGEVKAKQELGIAKLSSEGLNSFQIAERLKLNPGYIRKVLSNLKKEVKEG